MKTSYLSITILIAFLPAFVPTFNIFNFNGTNETLAKSQNSLNDLAPHVHHAGCPVHHKSTFDFPLKDQLKFGAELGKFIKATQIEDTNYKIKRVVIDPGHGGKDPGCSGTGTQEKKIALSVALQLGRTLESYFPGVEFIFTRKTDVFVELNERAKIANENNADLFISIHCNNFPKSANVKGSETYVLGLHRAKDNLEVAKRENAAIFYEDDYQNSYDGYDPNSTEGHIILSMFQNAFLEQSILFANKVEKNIKNNTQQKSRGVKQAGFLVLRKTTMPSVLVETGYLSNQRDNKFLSTANGQAQIVNAIAQAFVEYKKEVENGTADVSTDVYASTVKRNRKQVSATNPVPVSKPKIIKSPAKTISPNSLSTKSTKSTTTKSGYTKPANQSLIISNNNKENTTTPFSSSSTVATPTTTGEAPVQYKVLLASVSALVDTDSGKWNEVPYSVQVIKDGNSFKYLAIGFENFEQAVTAKTELRRIGFKEAFLVAYQNGKRIDMKFAMSKTGIK